MADDAARTPPPAIAVFGWLAAAPYAALAAASWLAPPPYDADAIVGLQAWGACALVFMGAVHWGVAAVRAEAAVARAASWRRLVPAALPVMIGWLALVLAPALGIAVLFAATAVFHVVDGAAARTGLLPAWYARARRPAGIVGAVSLGAVLIRLF